MIHPEPEDSTFYNASSHKIGNSSYLYLILVLSLDKDRYSLTIHVNYPKEQSDTLILLLYMTN